MSNRILQYSQFAYVVGLDRFVHSLTSQTPVGYDNGRRPPQYAS
jgi:hypothetical protein